MAAANSIPRFREKSYKKKSGKVHTYYVYDMRGRGAKDIRLGTDKEIALNMHRQCELGIFPEAKAKLPRKPKAKKQATTKKLLPMACPKRRRVVKGDAWQNAPSWVRTMYFNAERRAAASSRSFLLTPAEMLDLVTVAGGCCQLSKIPFEPTKLRSPFAPSIDRIDCSKGYQPGNVRLISHVANVAMNTWGLDPVIRLARAVMALDAPN